MPVRRNHARDPTEVGSKYETHHPSPQYRTPVCYATHGFRVCILYDYVLAKETGAASYTTVMASQDEKKLKPAKTDTVQGTQRNTPQSTPRRTPQIGGHPETMNLGNRTCPMMISVPTHLSPPFAPCLPSLSSPCDTWLPSRAPCCRPRHRGYS